MSTTRTIAISTHWTRAEAEAAAIRLAAALAASPAADYQVATVATDDRARTFAVTVRSEDSDPITTSLCLTAMMVAAGKGAM